jgi:hypothetical protein
MFCSKVLYGFFLTISLLLFRTGDQAEADGADKADGEGE